MPEYQGLKYTIGKSMPRQNTRAPKGKRVEAQSNIVNWTSTWLYEKSTQSAIERKLAEFVSNIHDALAQNYGALVVCQYRKHGPSEVLHDVFFSTKALNRTLAMSIDRIRHNKPMILPALPHGWHINRETYLWFDPKNAPKSNLDTVQREKERSAKINQGPRWETVK